MKKVELFPDGKMPDSRWLPRVAPPSLGAMLFLQVTHSHAYFFIIFAAMRQWPW